jgi:tetratricopeptide (TPR) repeat protein
MYKMSESENNPEPLNTKTKSTRQIRTRVIENFIIIWLNIQSNKFDKDSINQLRKIINSIQTFSYPGQCIDYLSQIQNEKVFLIISKSFDHDLLSFIEPMSQLNSIYLLSDKKHDYQKFKKVKGIYNKIDLICTELKHDIHQCQNDLIPISILTKNSLTNLNELDQSFMYSQLIKEILLDMDYNEKSKKELIDFCRIQYAGNHYELQIINEFERDYKHPSPIWWYTRNCFTYSMLNKALRIQDTELIIKMGFFIRDLHKQIEELYSNIDKTHPLTVYHGQRISNNEFEKLLQSKDGLLSFNNFLSTSTDRLTSLNFAKQLLNNSNVTSILFKMEINNPSIPFASIDKLSYFSDTNKQEILFSMHTIFHIDEIKQIENHLWQVDLTLTNDKDEQLKRFTDFTRKNARAETGIQRIAKLMLIMDKIDKAKEIYTALLETTDEDDKKELAHLHHQLGVIYEEKDDLINALSHYHQSLNLYLTYLPLNDPQLCSTYSNIGLILKKQGNFDGALEYFLHALDIGLISPNPDQYEIAIRYNNIGGVLDAQGKRTEALENYEHALKIEYMCLPSCHPLIGATHNNIGLVYQSMNDYSSALTHFKKTLEIEEKSLPSDHPSLIMTHANIAGVLEDLHQYKEAIEHAEKAVHIVQNTFGIDHLQTQMLQDYLEQLRQKQ